jgi:Putative transposase
MPSSAPPHFVGLRHLQTREVAAVLDKAIKRILTYLKRKRLLHSDSGKAEGDAPPSSLNAEAQGHAELIASAVSGSQPPAGPSFPIRTGSVLPYPIRGGNTDFERHLCVGRNGFTLHAASRAGGADSAGREALLKYILRPPVAQERLLPATDGLVRITLKRAFADGTVAIDLDLLSLLSRLAAAVPYPRFHTVRYAGVLASASKLRPKIAPPPPAPAAAPTAAPTAPGPVATSVAPAWVQIAPTLTLAEEQPTRGPYRPWAELLKRTFQFDVLHCPACQGRMRLLAVLSEGDEVRRYLRAIGEPTELPAQTPARAPP